MQTQIADLKIRFFDEISEKWMPFWLNTKEVCDVDWSAMKIGMQHFTKVSAVNNKDGTPSCEVFLYKTKTQRIICIKAYKEP